MLVLGYYFERLVREGKVKNYAEIARLTGLSNARVSRITNLTLLAPEIQNDILIVSDNGTARSVPREHDLRQVTAIDEWAEQCQRVASTFL